MKLICCTVTIIRSGREKRRKTEKELRLVVKTTGSTSSQKLVIRSRNIKAQIRGNIALNHVFASETMKGSKYSKKRKGIKIENLSCYVSSN